MGEFELSPVIASMILSPFCFVLR